MFANREQQIDSESIKLHENEDTAMLIRLYHSIPGFPAACGGRPGLEDATFAITCFGKSVAIGTSPRSTIYEPAFGMDCRRSN